MFARVSRERDRSGRAAFVPTWVFLAGYLVAWTVYGLVAYGGFRLVTARAAECITGWNAHPPKLKSARTSWSWHFAAARETDLQLTCLGRSA